MKKAIYTAIFGDYDNFAEPKVISEGYTYFLFTDQPITSKVYNVINVKSLFKDPAYMARNIKINYYKYLPGYDYVIWHDANLIPKVDLDQYRFKQKTDFMLMKHPDRSCVYDEINACLRLKKDDPNVLKTQLAFYNNKKYPAGNGLYATGLMFRKNTQSVKDLMIRWWNEVRTGTKRDQISLPYVLDIRVDLLSFNVLYSHFDFVRHK